MPDLDGVVREDLGSLSNIAVKPAPIRLSALGGREARETWGHCGGSRWMWQSYGLDVATHKDRD